jgi:hypothetical protein
MYKAGADHHLVEGRAVKIDPHSLVLPHSVTIGLLCSIATDREEETLHRALESIITRLGHILHSTPYRISFLTGEPVGPNAALIARVIREDSTVPLSTPGVTLYLPREAAEYLEPGIAEKLSHFIGGGATVRVISPGAGETPPDLASNHEAVVKDCDLLVVASRGRPDEDRETVHILRFARLIGRSLFHINSMSGSIIEMRNHDRYLETLEHLNTYNAESLEERYFSRNVQNYANILTKKIIRSGIPPDAVRPLCRTIMPHFARAHLLARHYERMYRRTGNVIYSFSALAVLTITLQTLFFPAYLWIVWLEVLEIAVIIFFLIGSRAGEWHRKWIDYRFLAERIRAAFFLCIVCAHCEKPATTIFTSLAHRPNDWMVIAFERVVESRPMDYCRLDIPFQPLKTFILDAWVDNRLNFFSERSEANRKKYQVYANLGEAIFFLTLILAAVHASGLEFAEATIFPSLPLTLAALTIVLPAVGAAMAAIRVQREYQKNSERYLHIMRHLSSIRNQIHDAPDLPGLCGYLEEMNEVTLREQQDWRIIFRFREIEA